MSALLPLMLDLRGWRCAVLGGSAMAEEKVRTLLAADAAITVIASSLTPALQEMANAGRIEWLEQDPRPEHLRGFRLAISALVDAARNAAFSQEAERLGVLFNAADDPAHCRFILPSVHRQGGLLIAVSTSGRCPALAVRLKERFASEFGPHYAKFLEMAAELRRRLPAAVPDFAARRRVWYRIVDSPVLELIRTGRDAEARALVEEILAERRREEAA
ncbi:MAG: bifunctional precorrin-2 dehydrogenase/sirohydrochlorin ferrochelatase [Bryobacteraceae bacterium]